MADPARDYDPKIKHEITPPFLTGLKGGGESDDSRGDLESVKNSEANPGKQDAGSVAEREAKGSNVIQGPWKNKVSGAGALADIAKPGGLAASIKKKGPMLTIITIVIGLASIVSLFGGSAMLPMSILANVVQKFNTQETSLTIRTNRLVAKKLAGSVTSGSCSIIKVACRFNRPSNRFLKLLEDNGIKVLDKDNKVISQKVLFPNARPKTLEYVDSQGKKISIRATDIYQTLAKNAEFRQAFHNSTKTRFMSLADSIFNSVKARFGFVLTDKLKSTVDEKGVDTESSSLSSVEDNGAKAAAELTGAEGDAAAESAIRSTLSETAEDIVKKLGEAGKGDAIGLAAGAVCLVTDAPGIVIKVNRAFQMAQLVKYSVVFLSAFGAIKAGDASPAEASAIGAVLTKVVKGKSAMDSYGLSYAMTGNTHARNNNFKKYSPGSSIITQLGGFAAVSRNKAKVKACKYMTNPLTGAVINAAMAGTGVGVIGAAINFAIGYAVGEAVSTLGPKLIDAVMPFIPVQSILKYFFGDLTSGLSGEPVGDALASGAAHVMGQTSNAGGNMPLTTTQAVAYDNATKQVQLAYAQEDQATKSPLDASSPNTFLGSLVQRLVPYFANSSSSAGTASNTFGTMGKIVMGSFGMALQPLAVNAASSDSDEYKLCDDPEIKDNDIAAGPFCNIIYGVPPQYLNKDPDTIVNDLATGKYSGNIDEDTGEPVEGSDLAKWIELCTSGTTDQADNCKIKDDKFAEFAVYTIDHRIQKTMDGEDTVASDSTTPTAGGTSPGVGNINIDYTDNGANIPCAAGTTDTSPAIQEGYRFDSSGSISLSYGGTPYRVSKVKIRTCHVGESANKPVNSQISASALQMLKDNSKLKIFSGFRDMTLQTQLWFQNGQDPAKVAEPGTSNHQMGIAMDLGCDSYSQMTTSDSCFTWLKANASKYGFKNYDPEPWHWSVTGG